MPKRHPASKPLVMEIAHVPMLPEEAFGTASVTIGRKN